ncbi:DUF3961 domain-containing protein [Bacillus cereus]|nr:DUF3961 domain-containing protein [Bacillus cereus]
MNLMTNTLFKIKSDESILTYPHRKHKSIKKFYVIISENCKKINAYFGIEDNVSDQIWFYGFFVVSISMLLFTYIFAGIMYGF